MFWLRELEGHRCAEQFEGPALGGSRRGEELELVVVSVVVCMVLRVSVPRCSRSSRKPRTSWPSPLSLAAALARAPAERTAGSDRVGAQRRCLVGEGERSQSLA